MKQYKKIMRDSWIYKLIQPAYKKIIDRRSDRKRLPLLEQVIEVLAKISNNINRKKLELVPQINDANGNFEGNLSIISSNCFAGRIMQDLKMEYNSPTLGLYFMYPDYIEFLSNLKYYLTEAKIEFKEHSKYPIGDTRRDNWRHWYPIGLLDGKVEIHFLHYYTEEEAASKWYRRAARVNFDNLLIVGMQQNLCTDKDIKDFDALPYENKIMFSCIPLDLKSNEYMPEFRNTDNVGDPYKDGDLFYKHLIKHFSDNTMKQFGYER